MPTARVPLSDVLDHGQRIVVRQARDWVELLDVEAVNRYALLTEGGALAGMALETPGNFLLRWILKARRPFEMGIFAGEADAAPVLQLRRPWTWFFGRVEVADAGGRPLGVVRERFAWFRRRFDVEAPDGRLLARIVGPFFRPWTFLVHAPEGARELGRIEKKWSGAVSELFTDADTFLVTLPADDPRLRRLVLGAAILVDFRFFENTD
jgi:uncharacterized protein YxjI